MKYADKVIELMAAMPGREFRMVEIVRYVCPIPKSSKDRSAVREGVRIVLLSLIGCGNVACRRASARGRYAAYRWL